MVIYLICKNSGRIIAISTMLIKYFYLKIFNGLNIKYELELLYIIILRNKVKKYKTNNLILDIKYIEYKIMEKFWKLLLQKYKK